MGWQVSGYVLIGLKSSRRTVAGVSSTAVSVSDYPRVIQGGDFSNGTCRKGSVENKESTV